MANFFDLFAVIAAAGLGILGFREGVVKGAVKLVGFILVLVLLSAWAERIAETALMVDRIPPKISAPLAFVVLFGAGIVAVNIIASVLAGLIALTPAHFVDAGLGCVFGMVKALFLAGLLALLLSYSSPDGFLGRQYRASALAPELKQFAVAAVPFLKSAVVLLYKRFEPVLPGGDREKPRDASPDDLI